MTKPTWESANDARGGVALFGRQASPLSKRVGLRVVHLNKAWMSMKCCRISNFIFSLVTALGTIAAASGLVAQETDRPWMNPKLSPGERADLVLKQMTLDEKLALVYGNGMAPMWIMPLTNLANGGAGYVVYFCSGAYNRDCPGRRGRIEPGYSGRGSFDRVV